MREYYSKNRDRINASRREYNREWSRNKYRSDPESGASVTRGRQHKHRAYIQARKDVPCMDCGIEYPPYIMDFDHVRGEKLFGLAHAVNLTMESIIAEISKCDVVCANCHRERTHGKRKESA